MTEVLRNVMATLFVMIAIFAVVCLVTGGGPLQSPAALLQGAEASVQLGALGNQ